MSFWKKYIRHPLLCNANNNFSTSTVIRRKILMSKPFLKSIMTCWYEIIAKRLTHSKGFILEIGSGAGFFAEFMRARSNLKVVSTEIFSLSNIDIVTKAEKLPFKTSSISAIVMTNVMHHIANPKLFFAEATRVLKSKGDIVMIEPWGGIWAKVIYSNIHNEPFNRNAKDWEQLEGQTEVDYANNALPWIIFHRDIKKFEFEFPTLEVIEVRPFMPFLFLLSGGISTRVSFPKIVFNLLKRVENMFRLWFNHLGMFVIIRLKMK